MKLRVPFSIILVFIYFLFLNSDADAKIWNFVAIQYSGGEASTQNISNHRNIPEGYTSFNTTSVSNMVSQIESYMSSGDEIGSLEIRGHGHPGTQSVGGTVTTWQESDMSISVDNIPEWQNTLSPLVGRFATDGQVSLYGCQVASDEEGAQLVYELQAFLETNVQGAVDTVFAGFQGMYDEYGDIILCPYPSSEPPEAQSATWSLITAILFVAGLAAQGIPTLSEWKRIFLILFIVSTSFAFIRHRQYAFPSLENSMSSTNKLQWGNAIFENNNYCNLSKWCGSAVILGILIVGVFYQEIKLLDIVGMLICAPFSAYIMNILYFEYKHIVR